MNCYRLILSIVCTFGLACYAVADDAPAAKAESDKSAESAAQDAKGHDDAKAHDAKGHDETAHTAKHGGHHDETDLSHQNAGPQQADPSEFKRDLAIWTFVVFFLLMALLLKFAWRPVMEGLDKREQSIAAMVEEAKRNAAHSAELLKQHELKLNAATDEARELIMSAKRDAESMRDKIVADAQSAAQRERERAVADIESAKNAALSQMAQKSVDIAFQLANGIVKKQLNRDEHSQLIRETLDRFTGVN